MQRRAAQRQEDRGPVAAAAKAFEIPDIIRTATNLVPADVEEVRIVDIVGLDQQADSGTHVASTAAVGRMSVVKVENKGKGSAASASPSATDGRRVGPSAVASGPLRRP